MDPDCAAAADGQEQLPEHATVAVASAPPLYASEYVPAAQVVQTEAPAPEDVPALQSMHVDDEFAPTADEYLPATPRHPHSQFTPNSSQLQAGVTPWQPAGVRSGAIWGTGGLACWALEAEI